MQYVIRVKGHLDPFWQARLENLSITQASDGTTLLTGAIKDQPALYGLLFKLQGLGLTLLSLETGAPIQPSEA